MKKKQLYRIIAELECRNIELSEFCDMTTDALHEEEAANNDLKARLKVREWHDTRTDPPAVPGNYLVSRGSPLEVRAGQYHSGQWYDPTVTGKPLLHPAPYFWGHLPNGGAMQREAQNHGRD